MSFAWDTGIGVQFPQLYRISGFGYDIVNEGLPNESSVQSSEPAPVSLPASVRRRDSVRNQRDLVRHEDATGRRTLVESPEGLSPTGAPR
jgi:hypothetical protein